MSTMTSPSPLRGIIPPLLTPLKDRDTLDVAGLERLVEHVLSGGVHGVFVLGTTGEGPALGGRLRRETIERVCALVAGRVPVLAGVTDPSFTESVELARFAAEKGASAAVLSVPYYFPIDQEDLARYVETIVPELPLPVYLYNIPSHTKAAFAPETVRRAMNLPRVLGLKDSSGNMTYFHRLAALLPERSDWSLLIGPEELLAEGLLLGGSGGICGGANLCPRLYVELYQAATNGDLSRARELHAWIMRLSNGLYTAGGGAASFLRSLKCALNVLGVCDDLPAPPFTRLDSDGRRRAEAHLEQLGITREHPWPTGLSSSAGV